MYHELRKRGTRSGGDLLGGKALSFGELATALLESSERSLMFIAPPAAARARGGSDNAAKNSAGSSA